MRVGRFTPLAATMVSATLMLGHVPVEAQAGTAVKAVIYDARGGKLTDAEKTVTATFTTKVKTGQTIQWLRNSTPIAGATGTKYKVTEADWKKNITVKVCAGATCKTSKFVTVAKALKLTAKTPKVSDTTPKVGQALTANTGVWKPADTRLSYQWLRNDKKLSGATQADYTVVNADQGKKLSVTVTGKRIGYKTVTKTSARTAKVAKRAVALEVPTIRGGVEIDAQLIAITNKSVRSYQWLRDGKPIQDEEYQSYFISLKDPGHDLAVTVCDEAKVCKTSAAKEIPALPKPVEFDIDNNSKASVQDALVKWRKAAQRLLAADETPVVGADLANCVTGRLSDTQRTYSTSLLNFYRELAGVPKITYDTSRETGTMNAAVLNSVNGQFSHSFSKSTNPKCWDQLSGNTTHNILSSFSGLSGNIPGWIDDNFNVQDNVGHRANQLNSRMTKVAYGLTAGRGISAGVGDAYGAAPTWPSAGYFPAEELPTRWSYDMFREADDARYRAFDPIAEGLDRNDFNYWQRHADDTVTVTLDGKTIKSGAVEGDGWFRMSTGPKQGSYEVTVKHTFRITVGNTNNGKVIFTKTYPADSATYTVRVF